jgi:hypothetical protein
VNFWAKTVIRYFAAALAALLLAFAVSIVATMSIAGAGDDLGSGFLWFLIFVPLACLFISASLGITAELVQRKVSLSSRIAKGSFAFCHRPPNDDRSAIQSIWLR